MDQDTKDKLIKITNDCSILLNRIIDNLCPPCRGHPILSEPTNPLKLLADVIEQSIVISNTSQLQQYQTIITGLGNELAQCRYQLNLGQAQYTELQNQFVKLSEELSQSRIKCNELEERLVQLQRSQNATSGLQSQFNNISSYNQQSQHNNPFPSFPFPSPSPSFSSPFPPPPPSSSSSYPFLPSSSSLSSSSPSSSSSSFNHYSGDIQCKACNGTGKRTNGQCHRCGGHGTIKEK